MGESEFEDRFRSVRVDLRSFTDIVRKIELIESYLAKDIPAKLADLRGHEGGRVLNIRDNPDLPLADPLFGALPEGRAVHQRSAAARRTVAAEVTQLQRWVAQLKAGAIQIRDNYDSTEQGNKANLTKLLAALEAGPTPEA